MRIDPTVSEVESYQEQGFVVMDDFLDAAELQHWREAVQSAVGGRQSRFPGGESEFDPADPNSELARYYDRVFTQRVNLWQTDAGIKSLIIDERIGRLATHLAGVEGMRLWHDQALIKRPFANPTAYHLDVPIWSFSSPNAISIWVALDDATLENGCMWYVPGTHKAKKFDNAPIGDEIGALFDVYPEWRGIAPVPAPVRAGGCIWHNGLTAHGAGANMSSGFRRAMTAGFMPLGSTFNGQKNILRDDQIARLSIGDVLDDPNQNPVVYSRSGQTAVTS